MIKAIDDCIQLNQSPFGDDGHDGGFSKIVVFAYNVKIFERNIVEIYTGHFSN